MLSRWGILAALCEAAHRQFVTHLGRTWGQEGHPKAESRSVLPTWAPPETWHCHQLQRCQTGLEWAWELLMWQVLKACKHQLLPSEPTELGTREQTWINAVHGKASCQQRCCWCCNAQLTAISINLKRTLDIWLHLHHMSHIPPHLGPLDFPLASTSQLLLYRFTCGRSHHSYSSVAASCKSRSALQSILIGMNSVWPAVKNFRIHFSEVCKAWTVLSHLAINTMKRSCAV